MFLFPNQEKYDIIRIVLKMLKPLQYEENMRMSTAYEASPPFLNMDGEHPLYGRFPASDKRKES